MSRFFFSLLVASLLLGLTACTSSGPKEPAADLPSSAATSAERRPDAPEASSKRPGQAEKREIASADPALVTSISHIQGAGHISPLRARRVTIQGTVTALGEDSFFIQDPVGDGDPMTSEGLFVVRHPQAQRWAGSSAEAGQQLELTGHVDEIQHRANDLTVTALVLESSRLLEAGSELPAAVEIGAGGRIIPARVADDDGLRDFEPGSDAIDFFESLEGMRVEVPAAQVTGATGRRGDAFVMAVGDFVAAGAEGEVLRLHPRGGILRREGDANPRALLVEDGLGHELPDLDVGQGLDGIDAVLDYGWGSYRLRLIAAPSVSGQGPPQERTRLVGDDRHLTLGSFNVLNLAANDPPEKAQKLATVIVDHLRSPDILGVQEIQDDNGAEDDGTVSATGTYQALIDAILAAGGPLYEVRQIDPEDKADGGRPGGNIRVGFLFRPDRLEARDATPIDGLPGPAPHFRRSGERVELRPSPARLFAEAFIRREEERRGGTRKPLLAQFRFHDRDLFVINLHLISKGADDRVYGDRQPPTRHSEAQRTEQALAVRGLVDELLALDPTAWIVVLGDLNEHRGRPPIQALEKSLVNLIERVPASERYTYVYRGQAQILDHVLVSPAIAEHAAPEIDIVHVASDYAASRQASDHEPMVIRLRFQ